MRTDQTEADARNDDVTVTVPLTNSRRQLAGLLLVFAVVIVLLESGGLLTWAQNLPVGAWRSLALPVVTALHDGLRPAGIERLRERTLAALDRLDAPATTPAPSSTALAAQPASATTACAPSSAAASASAPVIVDTVASLSHVDLPVKTALPALPPLAPSQSRVVALVGDSMMAVGLGDNLLRGMAAHKALVPVRAFRSGTGLSRPEVFDWMAQYAPMLGKAQPDVIIVAIGANDGQGFVENGKVMAFGTDDWVRVYETRLGRFLDLLTQHGAQVLWMSLPPMRSAQYNTRIDLMNRIAYQVVRHNPHAAWWSSAAYLGDAAGHYREYAKSESGNGMIRLRAPDGIHMSDDGGSLVAAPLLAWLEPAPAMAPAVASSTASNPATSQNVPSNPSPTRHGIPSS